MGTKNAILIIDPQYDFCSPQGALFVKGADDDMKRLHHFIISNADAIDHICVTLDSHPVNDISHPAFWRDEQGNPPVPFTQISLEEVKKGKWFPHFYPQEALDYLYELEKQGEFPHFIWPEHCLMGSRGAAIDDTLLDALKYWTHKGNFYQTVVKGTYPLTEHFGIFMAQIPIQDRPETQLNTALINSLMHYQHIYLAGEAKSHCVATSLRQAIRYAPLLAQKMIILEDCMSDVEGLAHLGTPIYEEAKKLGIAFATSTTITL